MNQNTCKVLENRQITKSHFVMKLSSSQISSSAKPGQFIQVQCSQNDEPFLKRPFSFLDARHKDFSILYDVVGKGTTLLSEKKKGDSLSVIGPLGNGFEIKKRSSIILVGGGVGTPPLYFLARMFIKAGIPSKNIHVFLGAKNKSLLLCENEFKKLRVNLIVVTDDGSKGKKGFVTDLLTGFIKTKNPNEIQVYGCGPTPMLKVLSMLTSKYEIPCQVSVEEPMACGFGACMGCVIKVKSKEPAACSLQLAEKNYRFALACKEGPVFEAKDILWE